MSTAPVQKRVYSHRSKADLLALRADVEGLTTQQKAVVSIALVRTGAMFASWMLEAAMRLTVLRHGEGKGIVLFASHIAHRSPEMVEEMWKQALDHMVDGKDACDPLSAGGWNGPELATFIELLEGVGWQRPTVNAENATAASPAP